MLPKVGDHNIMQPVDVRSCMETIKIKMGRDNYIMGQIMIRLKK